MLDPDRLLRHPIPEVAHAWGERDAAFYALALGIPAEPLDPQGLRYAYEGAPGGLRVLPTFATVLADPGFWLRDPALGLDWPRMLHAAQSLDIHRPLRPRGEVRSRSRVVEVRDGGRDRGAWVVTERILHDAATDAPWCTLRQTSLLRGDGGFAEAPVSKRAAELPRPAGAPDAARHHRTPVQSALMFRFCADMNPLHVDPDVAAGAGYERPILHGMATYGVACHGVLVAMDWAPEQLARFEARFTAPVFPGELLRTHVWRGEDACRFDVTAVERDVVVLRGAASEVDRTPGFRTVSTARPRRAARPR